MTPLNTIQNAAQVLRQAGLAVCRIATGKKTPKASGWTTESAFPSDFQPGDSIGILTSWIGCNDRQAYSLVCVDLDSAQALANANDFLPPTAMMDGRPSKPNAHRYYLIPNDTIPADAVAAGSAAARMARDNDRHPGPKTRHFKSAGIDFQATGAQVVAPPSLHSSGEVREWSGGVMGEPAIVHFRDLTAAVELLAVACGWRRPTKMPCCKVASSAGEVTAPVTNSTDADSDPRGTLTVDGVDYTLAEREGRAGAYIDAIPERDLSRSGQRGHDTLFRVLKVIVNDFAVRWPDAVQRLADAYNARLPAVDKWSEDELAHKLADALNADPDPERPFGCKLAERGPPREWKNSERLAEALAESDTVRFIRGTAFIYTGAGYRELSDAALNAKVWAVAERAAKAEFYRLRKNWQDAGEALNRTDKAAVAKHAKAEPKVAPNVTDAVSRDAAKAVRARNQLPDGTDPTAGVPGKLVVVNGILDLTTRELTPHTPDVFTLTALPTQFDPAAECPTFHTIIRDVTEGDAEMAAILQELAGACLDANLPLQFFAVLTGDGANGKSVFLSALRSVLGDTNVSAVGLEKFSERFGTWPLLGKLANLKGDQGYLDSKDEGHLKEATGGDLIPYEQKGKDVIHGRLTAKLIFATNSPPTFSDPTSAVWRRLKTVPFTWTCPPELRNPAFATPAHWDAEAPGILNWMLAGLQRLRANGRFTRSAKCEKSAAELSDHSNPAAVYLRENYEQDPGGSDTTGDIGSGYRVWQEREGYPRRLTGKYLPTVMGQVFKEAVPYRTASERGWRGIRKLDVTHVTFNDGKPAASVTAKPP